MRYNLKNFPNVDIEYDPRQFKVYIYVTNEKSKRRYGEALIFHLQS